jgi:hypothetical protein
VDDFGNFKISIAPTVFFANRAGDSFPGVRGLEWFGTPREALDRLEILLRVPIVFEKAVGHGTDPNPIWMWRGRSLSGSRSFQRLTETRCLLNAFEFEMERIAAFRLGSYAYDFVYVEVRADQPIGIYDNSDISERVAVIGYASEEIWSV